MKELLMGNEAIAVGALAAGVRVVSGYPGTPSSEVLETIARRNPGGVHVEWSVNEKAGAEIAAGAAYSGARSMVTMKQMGLNVASDPIMCVNYIGVKAGMVIYVADDPGPISSQTEQDTRHFARYARIPVFDCDSPEQAFHAVQDAFAFSEEHGTPVILRSTTRVCHACADIDVPRILPPAGEAGFAKDPKWVIFPGLSYKRKQEIVRREEEFSALLSDYEGNTLEGFGPVGIACGGISYAYVKEALIDPLDPSGHDISDHFTIFKVATPYPFPAGMADRFMKQTERILVFEELDPFIEDALVHQMGASGIHIPVLGKRTGDVPAAGELSAGIVSSIISRKTGIPTPLISPASGSDPDTAAPPAPDLPLRPPVLCAGCPHRGSFYEVKEAVRLAMKKADVPFSQAVFHGDIGCYTLGNAAPLNMVDTCLCMGAGITMAQGMNHADPKSLNFAFVGDSTFFASGITGTVNAVYNQADMILCVLDNSTTAMTGHQPHPGMGITMMGQRVEPIRIDKVLEGIGVPWIRTTDPLDLQGSVDVITEAISLRGVRAIIFRSPCIALFKPEKLCRVETEQCVGCMRCIREIGCPALSPVNTENEGRAKVLIYPSLCTGCGLCAQICPAGCIKTEPIEGRKSSGKEAAK